jgi:hypothetical protein
VCAASTVLGCLPVGGPPAGQQVVHDRTLTGAFFTPAESGTDPSFLFSTGPYRAVGDDMSNFSGAMVTDLYAHPYGQAVATAPGLTSLQPAVENLAPIPWGAVGRAPATDALARLFLVTFLDQLMPDSGSEPYYDHPYKITRYDPRTGMVGPVMPNAVRFSPSRARVFAGDASAGTLFELQASRDLTGVNGPIFIGEDFYYVDAPPMNKPGPPSGATLTRIKPNAEPEVLLSSSGWLSVTVVEGGQTPRLLVRQIPATSALPGLFMLDVDTLAITPLPSDLANAGFLSTSASGRWLLFEITAAPSSGAEFPTQTLTLVDWTTGTRTDLSPSLVGAMTLRSSSPAEWRPGHDELWIQTDDGAFKVTEPGDLVTAVSLAPGWGVAALQEAGTEWFSIFTRDGQHWFSRSSDASAPIYISSVDAPTSPPVQINPEGTWPKPYWSVGDGRLLVGASVEDEARQELFLVDPAAGAARALAGGGQVVAVGKTRALALLAWDGGRNCGALTLIDLASGAQTLLAEDVYSVAVDPGHLAEVPPDSDVLAPGTAIAFLSRGRFASPYDGLWLTLLP